MADKKISDLTAGSAIGGTEELPMVQSSSTVKTTINAIKTYFDTIYATISGYVKKGTLTTNYIPKATASDTIGNSQIVDDGSFVGIAEPSPTARLSVLTPDNLVSSFGVKIRQNVTGDDLFTIKGNGDSSFTNKTRLGIGDSVSSTARLNIQGISGASATDYIFVTYPYGGAYIPFAIQENGKILLQGLTASQIVETDASKNLISAAKGTAYNKDFGTGTTNVVEIGSTLGNSLITSTDANGKLQTLTTATYPSLTELAYVKGTTSSVQTQLDGKLTASNNLSDLSNAITARTTNLKMYDMFLTGGDQSTTSNVAANITDLVTPTLTANKRYKIQGIIHVGCNNTGGIKIQITLPTGATIFSGGYYTTSSIGNTAVYIINASATLSGAFNTYNGADGRMYIDGEVSLSSTAGTIQFGFASGTNTQTSTIYQLGTQLTVTQIN